MTMLLMGHREEVAVVAHHRVDLEPGRENTQTALTAEVVLEALPGGLIEDQALGPMGTDGRAELL
jgi:hypothetical protein